MDDDVFLAGILLLGLVLCLYVLFELFAKLGDFLQLAIDPDTVSPVDPSEMPVKISILVAFIIIVSGAFKLYKGLRGSDNDLLIPITGFIASASALLMTDASSNRGSSYLLAYLGMLITFMLLVYINLEYFLKHRNKKHHVGQQKVRSD